MELLTQARLEGAWAVIDVKGEVDLYTAPKLREELGELVERGRFRIIVDFAGIEFIDSSGLGVLVGGLRRVKEHGGTLAIAGPRPQVRKVLTITGLDTLFDVYETVSDATSG